MGVGAAASLLTAASWTQFHERHPTEACGIAAFVGKDQKDPAVNYLLEGLIILQNRGYDSAGVATIDSSSQEIVSTKYASVGSTSDSIEILKDKAPSRHQGDVIGIAHTRWATHGGKTDENAHPHLDNNGRIALVHNGTIENATELREELSQQGYVFYSQTDTEVIAVLIGSYLDQGLDLHDAVHKSLARLQGTWGLCIVDKTQPDRIIAARNGSPLMVGLGKDRMFLASEHTAFRRHASQYIALRDGEVAVITADGVSLDLDRIQHAPDEQIELSPAPYRHWTIREIHEQPEAISRALGFGGRLDPRNLVKLGGLEANEEVLSSIRHLVVGACGTSFFAGQYGAAVMRFLSSFDSIQTVDAAEMTPDHLPDDAGLLVVSQSGETKDVHRSVVLADSLKVPSFSVVNAVGSLIATSTLCGVYVNAGREQAVASTKAFVTQVTVMCLIAAWFSQLRNRPEVRQRRLALLEALHRLPIYSGMALRQNDNIQELAQKLKAKEHMFVLGRGFAEPIAREAALKIKEITYIHAEGYGGGALKHGPFALIEEGTPIILIIPDDHNAALMRTAAEEVRARGAYTIIVTDNPSLAKGVSDETILIPTNGPLTALLGIIPLQLLAYELAVARGIDPDKPKNLAKAVTVD
jgi:glucosamine--fructose-6-phosphate aminotransferase (isomerizing)